MIFWQTFMRGTEGSTSAPDLIVAIEYQLAALLSCEAPLRPIAKQYREVRRSNMCFGLDNFQSASGHMDSESFAHQMGYWIKLFEPRLKNINVEVHPRDQKRNQITFSVQADLVSEGEIHELNFNSQMNLSSQKTELEEDSFV
jgi:predicted component of type VI protein secretion system